MGPHTSELKPLDRLLRRIRVARVRPFIPVGAALLDLGCGDGELLRSVAGRVSRAVGIEPALERTLSGPNYELRPGRLPDDLPVDGQFDAITMLAVIEHLQPHVQARLADICARLLKPGGRVITTVPSERVDDILKVLLRLRLIAGIKVHEHHGFDPARTVALFPLPQFRLVEHDRFELGLNHLFVFERTAS